LTSPLTPLLVKERGRKNPLLFGRGFRFFAGIYKPNICGPTARSDDSNLSRPLITQKAQAILSDRSQSTILHTRKYFAPTPLRIGVPTFYVGTVSLPPTKVGGLVTVRTLSLRTTGVPATLVQPKAGQCVRTFLSDLGRSSIQYLPVQDRHR